MNSEGFVASNGIKVDEREKDGLFLHDSGAGTYEARMMQIQARKTQALREYFGEGSVDAMSFPEEFTVSWVAAPTTTDAEIDLLDKVTNTLIALTAEQRSYARGSLSPSREKPLGDWALEILRAVQK